MRQLDFQRARGRTLADDDVDVEVLHRRVEDFLDRRGQAVDLVDEERVALLEIREDGHEIAGLLQRRPEVERMAASISLAMMLASVVLPRPGGPKRRT